MSKPAKAASAHSPEQLAEFARQFAPKARRYRLNTNLGLGGFLVCLVGGMLLMRFWPMAFVIGFVGGVAFWLFTAIRSDFLPACPACHGDIGRHFGKFCRECGLKLAPDPENRIHPICPSGAHAFFKSEGKYRRGQIRHCPCCGLFLDERGL
jgi:hypothetical protein